MRSSALIRSSLAVLSLAVVLAVALAPPAHASWSEQGVVIDDYWLQHPWYFDRATLLHDDSGAYFAWLPYTFAEFLAHLDATQSSAWVIWAFDGNSSTANSCGPGLALDGNGGLFVLDPGGATRLHHVLPNGTQDWGDPVHGLVVDASQALGADAVADGSGGVWGAWGWATSAGVRLQHWLADGTVAPGWGPAGRLFPGGICPALARDGAGGVLLFFGGWSDGRAHVTRVQADTTIAPGWTAEGLDLGEFAGGGFHTVLLPSGDTGWIAIWQSHWEETLQSGSAQRFFLDGTLDPAWAGGAPMTMPTSADMLSCARRWPDTFSDGAGGFHHVWADLATGMPRWLHVTASGGCATGFGSDGIPPLRAGDGFNSAYREANFVAAPQDNGGIVFAWDDIGAGRVPAVRLRWLMPDGTDDPAAPDTGRVCPGTDSTSHIWGLDAGRAGGVHTLYSNQEKLDRVFLMNHMGRTPYVADVPAAPRPGPLALAAPWPTPTRGGLDVRCTLPGDTPATLALFDVSGRRLRDVTLRGTGDHVARLGAAGDLAPGVYLLRLTQGGETRTTRAVIVH